MLTIAREAARAHDGDPEALEITASLPDDLEDIPRLKGLGVSRLLVPVTPMAGMGNTIRGPEEALAWKQHIERFADV
ncbi:MAG: hypothetical protein E2O59_11110 [Gammaproteobacteria bacterium]|nr:MAG: hypothetical protein E2O59_11110 [Gammaproteobacteria bacterium]